MEIKVINHPNLVRDSESKAILNKDQDGHENYVKQRALLKQQRAEIDAMMLQLAEIKELILNIKDKN